MEKLSIGHGHLSAWVFSGANPFFLSARPQRGEEPGHSGNSGTPAGNQQGILLTDIDGVELGLGLGPQWKCSDTPVDC